MDLTTLPQSTFYYLCDRSLAVCTQGVYHLNIGSKYCAFSGGWRTRPLCISYIIVTLPSGAGDLFHITLELIATFWVTWWRDNGSLLTGNGGDNH